jgi:hypothetical protein
VTSDGDEWLASRSGRFTQEEKLPTILCTGSLMGFEAYLDEVEK